MRPELCQADPALRPFRAAEARVRRLRLANATERQRRGRSLFPTGGEALPRTARRLAANPDSPGLERRLRAARSSSRRYGRGEFARARFDGGAARTRRSLRASGIAR